MKKSFLIILAFTFSIFFSACNDSKQEEKNKIFTEKELPELIYLEGKKYSFPQITNPRGLLIFGDYAIIFERKNIDDNKFHVFDLRQESYIHSKGIDGLGPGEISVISQIEKLLEPSKVMVYDPELNLFSKFDLMDSNKLAERQFRAPEIAHFITSATFTSDTSILANTVDGWTKYLHLTLNGDTLALFGNWKDMIQNKELPNGYKSDELDANLISNLFQGPLKSNHAKTYAIKAGTKVDYIDIIRLSDYHIKTIYGPETQIQEFKINYWGGYQMPSYPQETSTTRYADVFAGEKSFFVLFRGKAFKEISELTDLNKIFEFDYEGNLLKNYQLDLPVFGISVDEKNRVIYGVTIDRDPNLIKYKY